MPQPCDRSGKRCRAQPGVRRRSCRCRVGLTRALTGIQEDIVRYRRFLIVSAALAAMMDATASGAGSGEPQDAVSADAMFLSESAEAMTRMMVDMHATNTGDINMDFVAMMIPHHQAAVDMAVIYLRYGTNEQLRRLAQEIVVEQLQEIAAMRHVTGSPSADGLQQPVPGDATAQPKH
jgi:hypothetical protein